MMITELLVIGIFLLGIICGVLLSLFLIRRHMLGAQALAETNRMQAMEHEHHQALSSLQAKHDSAALQAANELASTGMESQRLHSEGIEQKLRISALTDERGELRTALKVAENNLQKISQLSQELKDRDHKHEALRKLYSDQQVENAQLKTQIEQQRKQSEEKLQLLDEAKEKLSLQFTNLANRIFEEKSEKLHKHNQQAMDVTLSPLREQLKDFRHKVEEVYDKETRERVSLLSEIGQLKNLNQQMSKDALNLTNALKGDSKVQGNWGEVILEKVLEDSGLRKGHEYETQVSLHDGEGRRRNPDVVVRLPEGKDIVVDAKVSLLDYELYCASEDDDERQQALKRHIQSIRNHIQGLSFKEYENLEGIRTLDFVFIFIPIEAAFLLAVEHDQSMFREAYDKNIIIVSPTTLLATLRTVESIWRYERQNKNAEEIAKQAGRLHDQFVLVIESLDDMGRQLEKAQQAYEKTYDRFSKGRGNMVNRIASLEKLGAKVKRKIPDSAQNKAELEG